MKKFICQGDCPNCELAENPEHDVTGCAAIMTQNRTKRMAEQFEKIAIAVQECSEKMQELISKLDSLQVSKTKKVTAPPVDEGVQDA